MSAVVDSISEAVSPSAPLAAQSKDGGGGAHVSAGTPPENNVVDSDHPASYSASPAATLVDTTSSSIRTRIDTPPHERSISSNNRRVSISTATPLIVTFTPERNRQLYHYEEQEQQEPSDDEGSDNGHSNEPLLTTYRPNPANQSFEANTTSGSDINMSTFSSSAPEVSLGPQSVPFPLRQKGLQVDAHSTPSRPLTQSFNPRYRNAATPPVVIRPNTAEQITTTSSSNMGMTATAIISSGDDYDYKLLSSWRQEQIKTTRTAKLMAGTTPRPIPTLHGPLSLPYARNPSGVDATVADESAYLSHVFGLRAAGGITVTDTGIKTIRRVSSGTGTTTSRSVSGSSGMTNTTRSSQERSNFTEGSSYTTAGGTHQARPLVIRDPYQNIGIKIKGVPPREGPTAYIGKNTTSEQTEDKENMDPALSSRLRRRASETNLLEPKMGEGVIGPSRSQVNLRDLTALSPIPGSPADNAFKDPFRVLYDRALNSNGDNPAASDPANPSGHIQLPTLVPLYFNPTSMAYEVAIPQPRRSSYADLHVNTPQGVVTPQTIKNANASANQPSKADTSENWRKKKGESTESGPDEPTIGTATASAPEHSSSGPAAEGGIMTIHSLFEKFHPSEEQVDTADMGKPPTESTAPVKAESSKQLGLKSSKSDPLSPRGTAVNALSETTRKLNVNAPPYSPSKSDRGSTSNRKRPSSPITTKAMPTPSKANTSSAKGTPGAGKLLKKGMEEGEGPTTSASTAQAKGKGKARSGKK